MPSLNFDEIVSGLFDVHIRSLMLLCGVKCRY